MIAALSPNWAASRPVLATAAGLLCLGLQGCTGSSSPSAHTGGTVPTAGSPASQPPAAVSGTGTGTSHPCALLTQAEVAAAVGQSVNAGVESAPLGTCSFASADFAAGANLLAAAWESISAAANSGHAPPTPVSGIGDEALNGNGANGSTLYVRRGSAGFAVVLNGPNIDHLPDHGLAKEQALAALILPRL